MEGLTSEGSGGRPHRGRGDHRPCDLCRMRKTRCVVKDSLPCEKCRKASRVCTFEAPPSSRRRQQPHESEAAEAGPSASGVQIPIPNPQHLMPQDQALPFDPNGPGAIGSNLMQFDYSWDFFQAHSTANPFGLLSENSLNEPFPVSRPPSHPSLGDVAQSPNPLGLSPAIQQLPGMEQMEISQDEFPRPSKMLLGASAEMDPFLRQFYSFDASDRFQSSLRSFQSFDNDSANPVLFVETPRRVTDAIADTLSP